MANLATPRLPLDDSNDPEYFEILGGKWVKKESVGRLSHSEMNRIMYELLRPLARKINARLAHEWTIVHERTGDRTIPDVALSFPNSRLEDGYLVAPAFLVVETLSPKQRLNYMIGKWFEFHKPWGTPYCWILDPEKELAYELNQDSRPNVSPVEMLTAGPEIQIPSADIFNRYKQEL